MINAISHYLTKSRPQMILVPIDGDLYQWGIKKWIGCSSRALYRKVLDRFDVISKADAKARATGLNPMFCGGVAETVEKLIITSSPQPLHQLKTRIGGSIDAPSTLLLTLHRDPAPFPQHDGFMLSLIHRYLYLPRLQYYKI